MGAPVSWRHWKTPSLTTRAGISGIRRVLCFTSFWETLHVFGVSYVMVFFFFSSRKTVSLTANKDMAGVDWGRSSFITSCPVDIRSGRCSATHRDRGLIMHIYIDKIERSPSLTITGRCRGSHPASQPYLQTTVHLCIAQLSQFKARLVPTLSDPIL
ncbi:hypothetical protein C7974DRAFT_169767 [Boeremia exigua]|uniref:uncharacterized protein n=1 Tax=Boeremia exigua TaxID=749465 RepID=UPI001E8D701C|nr:uncharacterized protein C7974DRAFT_169767 [Boeremia exigua]KAH6633341.1 hypothetical protein C7974DRAFT_169767 [Boeremia exigua]